MATVIRRIGKKGVSYQVKVFISEDKDGKQVRESRTYKPSQLHHSTPAAQYKEVQALAEQWEEELKRTRRVSNERADKLKLVDLIPDWKDYLDGEVRFGKYAQRTIEGYIYHIEKHLVDECKELTVEDATEEVIQDLINKLRRKYSACTVKKTLTAVRNFFSYIRDVRKLPVSRLKDIVIAPDRHKEEVAQSLTTQQALLLVEALSTESVIHVGGERTYRKGKKAGQTYTVKPYDLVIPVSYKWASFFILFMTSGLRPQELFALHWEDVDLKKGLIAVTSAVSATKKYGQKIKYTKTQKSKRALKIPEVAVEILKDWQKEQMRRAKEPGFWKGEPIKHFDKQLVFPVEDGSHIPEMTYISHVLHPKIKHWNDEVEKLIDDAEDFEETQRLKQLLIPQIRPYDLRHTFGTLELQNGTPITVLARKMGHATTEMIVRRYAHPLDDAASEKSAFDDIISGRSNPDVKGTGDAVLAESLRMNLKDKLNKYSLEELQELTKLLEEKKTE